MQIDSYLQLFILLYPSSFFGIIEHKILQIVAFFGIDSGQGEIKDTFEKELLETMQVLQELRTEEHTLKAAIIDKSIEMIGKNLLNVCY